jgi:peptidylprolyl isomerase
VIATGFYKSLPVATQPISQAILTHDGKSLRLSSLSWRDVYGQNTNPNSANSQSFLCGAKQNILIRNIPSGEPQF